MQVLCNLLTIVLDVLQKLSSFIVFSAPAEVRRHLRMSSCSLDVSSSGF